MNPQLSFDFTCPNPQELFERVYRRLRRGTAVARFNVSFHPWAQLRSVIRGRNGAFEVQICDLLRDAPPIVLEALAEILIARCHRQKPSREARACYLAHVMSPAVVERIGAMRRLRGSKRLGPAQGSRLNLEEIFTSLNERVFSGRIQIRRIGWSRTASRTVLGHYDPAHGTISVSRALDHAPRTLVEFIVHHEMLHVIYPVERNDHRRVIHPRKFREAERAFPAYQEAQRLLKCAGWGRGWD